MLYDGSMTRATLLLLGWVSTAGAGEIVWQPGLATALERSVRENKPVLAYFTFDT